MSVCKYLVVKINCILNITHKKEESFRGGRKKIARWTRQSPYFGLKTHLGSKKRVWALQKAAQWPQLWAK